MGRPAPSFWWDFEHPQMDVIVQSDYPGGECLARFVTQGQPNGESAIAAAEKLIADYKAGRKTPPWRKP